jgi:hypothetical protein
VLSGEQNDLTTARAINCRLKLPGTRPLLPDDLQVTCVTATLTTFVSGLRYQSQSPTPDGKLSLRAALATRRKDHPFSRFQSKKAKPTAERWSQSAHLLHLTSAFVDLDDDANVSADAALSADKIWYQHAFHLVVSYTASACRRCFITGMERNTSQEVSTYALGG